MTTKFWKIALAIWLFLYCLLAVTNVRFDFFNTIMGILAAVTGILLLIDK